MRYARIIIAIAAFVFLAAQAMGRATNAKSLGSASTDLAAPGSFWSSPSFLLPVPDGDDQGHPPPPRSKKCPPDKNGGNSIQQAGNQNPQGNNGNQQGNGQDQQGGGQNQQGDDRDHHCGKGDDGGLP